MYRFLVTRLPQRVALVLTALWYAFLITVMLVIASEPQNQGFRYLGM
jgi:hypothetical protein